MSLPEFGSSIETLAPGEIAIAWLDTRTDAPPLNEAATANYEVMQPYLGERSGLAGLLNQTNFLTHAALRLLVARAAGVPALVKSAKFTRTKRGQILLPDLPLNVSVSHTGDFGIVAVANGLHLGVDLEIVGRDLTWPTQRLEQFREVMAIYPGTRELFLADEVHERFEADISDLASWTMLEALSKSDGRGVFALLRDLSVFAGDDGDPGDGWPPWFAAWHVQTWVTKSDLVLSVAAPKTARLVASRRAVELCEATV